MGVEPLLFAFSLLNTGAILFLLVYYVITLSDLECDYLNAQQCCSKLNFWVIPKFSALTLLAFLFLISGQWWLSLANMPMVAWMAYEFFKVPSGNMGVYDPTEIHNGGQLKKYLKECMIHLAYYLIFFFIYLYCMIVALLKGDPIRRHEDDMIVSEF